MNPIGKPVVFGQYRVTYLQDVVDGSIVVHQYAEVFVPENARSKGHYRLVTGKRRERVLAAARHPELREALR